MVTYQFEVDGELWHRWKMTVPRDTALDQRLRELIEADADGRVRDGGHAGGSAGDAGRHGPRDGAGSDGVTARTAPATDATLDRVDFPAGRDRVACEAAVEAARAYLDTHDGATMRELVTDVMPVHPVGYDVPELQEGERYRGGWWRHVVKPGLEAMPDVEKPPQGGSEWTVS